MYLAFISNTLVYKPIEAVFPGIVKTYPSYIKALKLTRGNYKT